MGGPKPSGAPKGGAPKVGLAKVGQNSKTLKLAKVGLAKVGQDHDWPKSVEKLAKVGLAKVGHDRMMSLVFVVVLWCEAKICVSKQKQTADSKHPVLQVDEQLVEVWVLVSRSQIQWRTAQQIVDFTMPRCVKSAPVPQFLDEIRVSQRNESTDVRVTCKCLLLPKRDRRGEFGLNRNASTNVSFLMLPVFQVERLAGASVLQFLEKTSVRRRTVVHVLAPQILEEMTEVMKVDPQGVQNPTIENAPVSQFMEETLEVERWVPQRRIVVFL